MAVIARRSGTLEFTVRRLRLVLSVIAVIGALDSWERLRADTSAQVGAAAVAVFVALADLAGRRAARSERVRREMLLVITTVVLDAAAAGLISLVLVAPGTELSWMPFVVPVAEAGLRYRLRGALAGWGGATLVKLAVEYTRTDRLAAQEFVFGAGVVLLLCASTALLAQLLFDELVGRSVERATAPHAATFVEFDGAAPVSDGVRAEVQRRLDAATRELGGYWAPLESGGFVVLRADVAAGPSTADFIDLLQQVLDWPFADGPARVTAGSSPTRPSSRLSCA